MIRDIEFEGLAAVELVAGGARLVVVHALGPRIAWFGRRAGRNLLFWDRDGRHRRGAWRLHGGHRMWVTRPLADESEETYAADEARCQVRRVGAGVTVTAPGDGQRLVKSLTIRPAPGGGFVVEHRIKNGGDMLWSGGIWALTCTRPGRTTSYGVPLGGGNPAWDVFSLVIPRRWGGGHTSRVDDPQIRFTERCLVVRPRGRETKRMIQAPQGTIGMTDREERVSFVKVAAYRRGARYPLDTNLAFYVGARNFMVELETMGAIEVVAPGETIRHVEQWTLRPPIDWSRP